MNGFREMLSVLDALTKQGIMFRMEQQRSDAVMVSFATVGLRVEIEFFEDHLEYSCFEGTEEVLDDKAELLKIIEEFK